MSFQPLRPTPASRQSYSPLSLSNYHGEALEQDDELDAAFDDPGEDEDAGNGAGDADEQAPLVLSSPDPQRQASSSTGYRPTPAPTKAVLNSHSSTSLNKNTSQSHQRVGYDFERDPYQHSSPFVPSSNRSPPSQPTSETPPPPASTRLVGMGGGLQNDGVFANLSAKPDGPRLYTTPTGQLEYVGGNDELGGSNDKAEVLPTYDSAALDSAPPYWETTVTLPGGGSGPYGMLGPDDVLVDGLPVGNLFGFAWNLLVSMSFQFIGFLLTYLLHTTHAAKNGSRAGLGITLIQYGLYTRTRAVELTNGQAPGDPSQNSTVNPPPHTTDPWGLFGPSSSGGDWDGSTRRGANEMPYDGAPSSEQIHLSSVANEWLSYMLIAIGWFLLLGGVVNYWRAVRWAKAVRSEETLISTLA